VKNNARVLLSAIGLLVVCAVIDERVGSSVFTYMILALLLIMVFATNTPTAPQDSIGMRTRARLKKKERGAVELGDKEKRMFIFYLLTKLEQKESLDMGELTQEMKISIYELNNIVRLLAKHGAIEVIYPPLQNFPIIRRGDPEKSKRYRVGIYHSLGKKTILGEERLDLFAAEVEEYLQGIKRDKD
jgi:hypothetical protein